MVANPRNRIVVFRLTQDEYCKLKEACDKRGASNISDFTRSEVLAFLHTGPLPDHVHLRFAALEEELEGLKCAVNHLNHLLEGVVNADPSGQP